MALIDGLQRYYPLNGNGTDVHGGVNAVVSGPSPAWVTGHVSAQALDLSASNSNRCRAAVFTPATFACSFWIYRVSNSTSTFFGVIGNMAAGAVTDNWFFLGANVAIGLYTTSNTATTVVSGSLPFNAWTHVVYQHSGTTRELYIDGSLFDSEVGTAPPAVVSAIDFLIGCRNDTYGNFPARFQEVGLWNRALSGAEITELYNAGAGRPYSYIAPPAPPAPAPAPRIRPDEGLKRDLKFDFQTGTFVRYDGQLTFATGRNGIAQAVGIRLRTVLGEWFLDVSNGLPYFDRIMVKNPKLTTIEALIKQQIESVPGIRSVKTITLNLTSARTLKVVWLADSDLGEITSQSIIGG